MASFSRRTLATATLIPITVELDDPVGPGLAKFPALVRAAISGVVKDTSAKAFRRIVAATPRDRGTAAGNWREKSMPGKTVLTNRTDYIWVLERGGYPVIPASKKRSRPGGVRRGRAVLDGDYPPGPRTMVPPGGGIEMLRNVSRQAPQGMVRKTLRDIEPEFVFNLEEAIDIAFAEVTR